MDEMMMGTVSLYYRGDERKGEQRRRSKAKGFTREAEARRGQRRGILSETDEEKRKKGGDYIGVFLAESPVYRTDRQAPKPRGRISK